jgi:hypothetical protein
MQKTKANYLQVFINSFLPERESGRPARRFDLDWLRVLVFALLIFYHIGMLYVVNWGYHIKSSYQSSLLENFMLLVEPWRMPVLWLISGIAIRFILARISLWRFISMRSLTLLLPLLFGILVIVPPQLYIEMSASGDLNMSYWQFMQAFFSSETDVFDKYQSGIWPHIDVNHLWYLRSLWQFSMLLVCILPLLNSPWITGACHWLFKQDGKLAIFIAVLPLVVIQALWPQDTMRYPIGFVFLVYGYLVGWNVDFWQKLKPNLPILSIISCLCFVTLLCFYNFVWLDPEKHDSMWLMLPSMMCYALMRLLGALTLCSFAYNFLNKNSKKLAYFSEGVYPFYILHQTIIIVAGYYLSALTLGPWVEPLLLIIITFSGCFIGFEIVRRVDFLRPCFGLKMKGNYHPILFNVGYGAVALCLLPIAYKIFMWTRWLFATYLV